MTGGRATPLDRKVDIFVAGFQKCGTSALCDLLDRHPQIGLSRPKEPAWFSGGRLARSEEEYLGFFPAKKTLWVDGSTAYSFPENAASVAAGIHKHNPEAKFIFVVRNPVNRVRSVLNHAMFENEKKLTPDQIVQRATRRSAYYAPISCFSSYFEKEAIFVLSMDELLLTQGKTVIDFLGLERLEEPLRPVNYTATRRKENFLTGFYRRNWRIFNRFSLQKKMRRSFSNLFRSFLMRKIDPKQSNDLSKDCIEYIEFELRSDKKLFQKEFNIDYMDLEQ